MRHLSECHPPQHCQLVEASRQPGLGLFSIRWMEKFGNIASAKRGLMPGLLFWQTSLWDDMRRSKNSHSLSSVTAPGLAIRMFLFPTANGQFCCQILPHFEEERLFNRISFFKIYFTCDQVMRQKHWHIRACDTLVSRTCTRSRPSFWYASMRLLGR